MASDLTLTTPLGQAKDPGPPPAPGIQDQPAGAEVAAPPKDLAGWYRSEMDALIPRFEAASKAAQESIAERGVELRGFRERAATAPGMPESPDLPESPAAPKITARPFLAGMPGEDPIQSLNKAMAGFGLMAQMAVGIKGGFPQGALAAYTGALQGWQAGDLQRGANQWQTYLGELKKHDRDVQSIRTKYDDAVRKWSGDQDRLKTELGILAAEHGLGREAIEMAFRDPERALSMLNTTATTLGDMQAAAANLALKNTMWLADRELKLLDFAQKERFHVDKLKAEKEKDRGPKLSDENALRQQFLTQAKDFVTIRDSYDRLSRMAQSPSPAGDRAIIFNFMKILDPGSVVRETEFESAARAGSYGERMKAAVEKAYSGEMLTPSMRADFVTQAQGLFAAQQANYQRLEDQFRGIAGRAGMDTSQIVVEMDKPGARAAPPAGKPPAAPSAGWGPVQVMP